MVVRLDKIPKIDREALTDLEALLFQLVLQRDECIQELKDEIARLKGQKEKPQIKPSRLELEEKDPSGDEGRAIESSSEEYQATSTPMILGPAIKESIAIAHILEMNGTRKV